MVVIARQNGNHRWGRLLRFYHLFLLIRLLLLMAVIWYYLLAQLADSLIGSDCAITIIIKMLLLGQALV